MNSQCIYLTHYLKRVVACDGKSLEGAVAGDERSYASVHVFPDATAQQDSEGNPSQQSTVGCGDIHTAACVIVRTAIEPRMKWTAMDII